MLRASLIEKESRQIATIKDLTGVFESIASTHVAKIRNKAKLSQTFFQLLWSRYSAIRIDPSKRITGRYNDENSEKTVYVVISSESSLSGDIDQRLIENMLKSYNKNTTDIIVLGTHGATQLAQRGISFSRYFQIPETDEYIDVSPVIEAVLPYSKIIVYYEQYVSLGIQEIKTIDLVSRIKEMSDEAPEEDIITDIDTIFEPSLDEIANQMESTMMTLALSETILESSLAQAASRFNAMAQAKKRANELLSEYKLDFHRAKRSESDRQLREVMVSIKKKRHINEASR